MYRYVRFFKDSTGSNRSIQACWIFLWVHFRVNGINRSHGLTRGDRGGYSSLITSIISFTPSRKPAMNISRSEMEDMSVIFSVSFSKSSFCLSERVSLRTYPKITFDEQG